MLLNLHDVEMQCLCVLSVVFAYTFGGFHFLRCFTLQDIRNSVWRQNVIPDDLDLLISAISATIVTEIVSVSIVELQTPVQFRQFARVTVS